MSEDTKVPEGITVALIVKNCKSELGACLKSLKPFIRKKWGDEIVVVDTGSTDDTARVALNHGAHVLNRPDLTSNNMLDLVKKYRPDYYDRCVAWPKFSGGFLSDFAKARTIATEAAFNNIVFWIDSDDILEGAPDLREKCAEFFSDPKNTAIFMQYDYAFDENDGSCTTILWRERILRRNQYVWKGVCHESMVPLNGVVEGVHRFDPQDGRIVHKNHTGSRFSDVRNYVILRRALEEAKEKGEWQDPRWLFYLGNACRGLEDFGEAAQWYGRLLKKSGSRDDRFTASLNLGMIYLIRGRPWRALDWFFQAHKIFPAEPRSYFGIARAYHDLGSHREAVTWTEFGRNFPKPDILTAVDPNAYSFYPAIFECLSLRELGDWQSAMEVAQQTAQQRPNFFAAQELVKETNALANNTELKNRIVTTIQHAHSPAGAMDIIQALKPELRQHYEEFQLESSAPQAEKHITYLCGPTVEPWDYTSDADGLGGSEKMVIQLTREWAKAGYKVDVYGKPKSENAYKTDSNGVIWKPFGAFNPKLPRDIVIIWRHHGILDGNIEARKIYVDLHDVQDPRAFTAARRNQVDGYFFKSGFHAGPLLDTFPSSDEKVIISRNGIDLTDFELKKDEPRDLQKVVFCSSADRGLLGTLRIWRRIQKSYPKATLHVFYGFTPLYRTRALASSYQHFWDEGAERHMFDYEEQCYQLMDKMDSVVAHGRVSHELMAHELSTAGVWLYPTGFPEISCMSAMEAQIAGAIPICSPTGALMETVQFGHLVKTPDEFVGALHKVFDRGHDLDTYRDDMSAWARKTFDVKTLARDWMERFEQPSTLRKTASL